MTLLLAAACATDADLPLSGAAAPIVDGTLAGDDGAVVALTVGGQHFCSGTLIADDIVLTAAHCLPPNVSWADTDIEVFFGTVFPGSGDLIAVTDGLAHPSWNIDELGDDVGILSLAQPASVAPIPMRTEPMDGLSGQPMRLVGYGITVLDGHDNGTRLQGSAQIEDLDAYSLLLNFNPSGTCNGDSGGTALFEVAGVEYVAGIHSRSDCTSQTIEERVDAHVDDFIIPFMEAHGHDLCGADGLCGNDCTSPDPDCLCGGDGVCNPECAPGDDPDCPVDPVCEADGTCNELCDEGQDPDCVVEPVCVADGVCNDDCAAGADPDCPVEPECVADEICNEDCAAGDDPDCGPGDDGGGGGCAVSSDTDPALALLLLALLALPRRRKP